MLLDYASEEMMEDPSLIIPVWIIHCTQSSTVYLVCVYLAWTEKMHGQP